MLHAQGAEGVAGTAKAVRSSTSLFNWFAVAAIFCIAILLGLPGAANVPDAANYRLLALGQNAAVASPFSARILAPSMAGWLGRATGLGVDRGFLILGVACLLALLLLSERLLSSQHVPGVVCVTIFLMPFWVDSFHDYYLADLLHAVLLGAILLCLVSGRFTLAMVLLFPAYVARESTLLVTLCLIFAAWKRIPLRAAVAGMVAVVAGALISGHFAALGAENLHGMGGGAYMAGKLFFGFFHNLLGIQLWSNTLPGCHPMWIAPLPFGLHLGEIHLIGVCSPSAWGPTRVLLAWFGIFGIGPALAYYFRHSLFSPAGLSGASWLQNPMRADGVTTSSRQDAMGRIIVFRFCVVYGLITLLLAPMLGASTDRLVEYGWPFYLVALPWLLAGVPGLLRPRNAWIPVLHLLTCWLAWYGFLQQTILGYAVVGFAVLGFNIAAYAALRKISLTGDESVTVSALR
jgi:hypothetical protein